MWPKILGHVHLMRGTPLLRPSPFSSQMGDARNKGASRISLKRETGS
jgi:hypothetical protein